MSDLKGKVLAGKVLVLPQAAEEKTISGIIIPDSAKEKPLRGTVVLVGAAKKDEAMEVKAGDAHVADEGRTVDAHEGSADVRRLEDRPRGDQDVEALLEGLRLLPDASYW